MSKCDHPGAQPASSDAGIDRCFGASQPEFETPRWLGNRHLQTIWPNRIKRHEDAYRLIPRSTAETIVSEDGDTLRLYWTRHEAAPAGPPSPSSPTTDRSRQARRPVLVVLHGLVGCADADNVLATAAKARRVGFDIVRVDLRNSQSDAPSLGIGHAGRSEDLRATLRHVAARKPSAAVAVVGFSLGGNIALKAAGEYGGSPPPALRAMATISVPVDLDGACTAIDERRENWIYRNYFLKRLARRYLQARAQRPDLFHPIDLEDIRGIRDWDDAVVAPLGGFSDAADYYARSSSQKVLPGINVPTLIVHARDDPFIPFAPFQDPTVERNEYLHLLAPSRGGHVGFYSAPDANGDPDRYWAENRALAFCARAVGLSWPGRVDGGAFSDSPRLPVDGGRTREPGRS